MKVSMLFLAFIFSSSQSKTQDLSREQAAEDLAELKIQFEKFHSGYTRYTPLDSLDILFDEIAENSSNMSTVDFYKEVTRITSMIRCGHTRASLPENSRREFHNSQSFLPFTVSISNEKLHVLNSLVSELKQGEEIEAINGLRIPQILKSIFLHHSADGFIETSKTQRTALFFHYYFQLYLADGSTTYEIKTVNSLKVVQGKSWSELEKIRNAFPSESILSLEHQDDYSYMRIGSFGSSSLNRNGYNYTQFLADSFKALKNRKVENLILDLRGNGGGKDEFGALLVSYLVGTDFRYFEKIEVTDDYNGYGNIQTANGRNLMTSHSGLSVQSSQEDSFKGKVYLLADGWTFSTAADVVSVLDNENRVHIVGQETGGGRFGNTSGVSKTVVLPNSKIKINLPMWKYTTFLEEKKDDGRGVIPDALVVPSIEQQLAGVDVQLQYCQDLISRR